MGTDGKHQRYDKIFRNLFRFNELQHWQSYIR
jgi:hypothetical protein